MFFAWPITECRPGPRSIAVQLVGRGETMEGFANNYYDAYRALTGAKYELENSQITRELLIKTRTNA